MLNFKQLSSLFPLVSKTLKKELENKRIVKTVIKQR